VNANDSSHSFRNECLVLSDDALVARLAALVHNERRATTELIAALAEFDRRKLYLGHGCSSLFTYCTQVLHLSEHAAFNRIEAARAASRFPAVLCALEQGWLTLTAVRLLSPILTTDNQERLLRDARHKSKRDVEHLVAAERPRADAADVIRRQPSANVLHTTARHSSDTTTLPDATNAEAREKRLDTPTTTPLSVERYRIQFTASKAVEEKLRRAQALLRHSIPGGQIEAVIERALDMLLASLEKQKWASTARPRTSVGRDAAANSRHVPAAVKREVWKRDGGRCAFVARSADAPSRHFSSSTTSYRLRRVGPPQPRTLNYGAAATTPTKRLNSSASYR